MSVLRFGVRGTDGLASPIWMLKTHRDEAYFFARVLGGAIKVSIHSARGDDLRRSCQASFTSEAWKSTGRPNARRHLERWHPARLRETPISVAFRLLAPCSEFRTANNDGLGPDVQWLEAPVGTEAAEFTVLLGDAGIHIAGSPGDSLGAVCMVSHEFKTGERLWCVRRWTRMTKSNRLAVETFKDRLANSQPPPGLTGGRRFRHPRVLLVGRDATDGAGYFVDVDVEACLVTCD